MAIVTEKYIRCYGDNVFTCDETFGKGTYTFKAPAVCIRKDAKTVGWTNHKEEDFCPVCSIARSKEKSNG